MSNVHHLLTQAQKHYKEGVALHRANKYDDSIVQFKKYLVIRESMTGRYLDDNLAKVYLWLGHCYYFKKDDDSYDKCLVAYRTGLRIRRYLSNDREKPDINTYSYMIDVLKMKKGWTTDAQIREYDTQLMTSLQLEKDGDFNRRVGQYKTAISNYMKAISVEENCLGSSASVAFIWRKIAWIICRQNNSTNDPFRVDWNKNDCINTKWLDGNTHNSDVFQAIRSGDIHYREFNYEQAILDYKRASAQRWTFTRIFVLLCVVLAVLNGIQSTSEPAVDVNDHNSQFDIDGQIMPRLRDKQQLNNAFDGLDVQGIPTPTTVETSKREPDNKNCQDNACSDTLSETMVDNSTTELREVTQRRTETTDVNSSEYKEDDNKAIDLTTIIKRGIKDITEKVESVSESIAIERLKSDKIQREILDVAEREKLHVLSQVEEMNQKLAILDQRQLQIIKLIEEMNSILQVHLVKTQS